MGFGFNLFCAFLLVPTTIVLLLIGLITKKNCFGKIVGFIWLGLICLVLLIITIDWIFFEKTNLKKKDYYGQYVVNRNYFKGKQADWQYNTFRFEIKKNDSLYFYVTDKEKILQTYKGTIQTTEHDSKRLIINMEQPTHHILSDNPTTYRSAWDFYLVFDSPKFRNVFFIKRNKSAFFACGKYASLHVELKLLTASSGTKKKINGKNKRFFIR